MRAITKVATRRARKRRREFVKRQARVPNKSKSQSAFVSLFSKKKGPWLWSRNALLLNAKVTIHLLALLPSRLFNVRTTHFRPERLATTKVGKGCGQRRR